MAGKVRYPLRLDRNNEYRIKHTILRHYDHTTRPVRNDKTAINVLVAISLYHILDTVCLLYSTVALVFPISIVASRVV